MALCETSPQQQILTPNNLEIFARINNKGQLTIPKQIRELYAIQKKSQLYISWEKGTQLLFLDFTKPKTTPFKIVKLSKTYRFTIPKEVRDQLHFPGTCGIFRTSETQAIVMEKAPYQFMTRAERLWIPPNKTWIDNFL